MVSGNFMKITISNATLNDVDTMMGWGENAPELWGFDTCDWYEKSDLIEWIKNPLEDLLFIARDGDKPVGMCLGYIRPGWAYIAFLYVAPEYRNHGIGKQLLQKMSDEMLKKGKKYIFLEVQEKNPKAKKLYDTFGFTTGHKLIWMQKKIK
jgi:ribosomal protein S18 acetylase RimI-like enzyme